MPAWNAAETIARSLEPLTRLPADWEVIVVDDHSTDRTADIARSAGFRVVASRGDRDPGVSRNTGADLARGRTLVFVDADVVVTPECLQDMVRRFHDSGAVCCFGIYDTGSHLPNLVSRFKNYWIRYTTLRTRRPVRWINTSLAVMLRDDFVASKGFSEPFGVRTGGGDIFVGRNLARRGRIDVDPRSEVQHLKRFDMARLVRNDFNRARGWLRLATRLKGLRGVARQPALANVRRRFSLGVAAAGLLPLALGLGLVWPASIAVALVLLVASLAVSLPLTVAAARDGVRGWPAFPALHLLDQLACAAALAVELPRLLWRRLERTTEVAGPLGPPSRTIGD